MINSLLIVPDTVVDAMRADIAGRDSSFPVNTSLRTKVEPISTPSETWWACCTLINEAQWDELQSILPSYPGTISVDVSNQSGDVLGAQGFRHKGPVIDL